MKFFCMALVAAFVSFASPVEAGDCAKCVRSSRFTIQPMALRRVPVGPPQTYERVETVEKTWSLLPNIERYRTRTEIVPVPCEEAQAPACEPVRRFRLFPLRRCYVAE